MNLVEKALDKADDTRLSSAGRLNVINIGLETFYDALVRQNVKVVQLDWRPPIVQSKEIVDLLEDFL